MYYFRAIAVTNDCSFPLNARIKLILNPR